MLEPTSLVLASPEAFTQLSVGRLHTCGVSRDGSVECWGDNSTGQAAPSRTPILGSFVQVSAGGLHTCALRGDGIAECWGENLFGQAPATRAAAVGVFTQVSTGLYHTCAVRSDGVIECWGRNRLLEAPTTQTPIASAFVQVSAGTDHTCAVRADGVVECWGNNANGGEAPPTRSPPAGISYTQVGASATHTCAVRSDGAVECWGDHQSGQAPPIKLPGASGFLQVDGGAFHSCGVRVDGLVECWGNNGNNRAPSLLNALTGSFTQIGAGESHSCALRSDGVVECWGSNLFGQAPATKTATARVSHVLPSATFSAPATVIVGQSFTLALSNAHVTGHPEATVFLYAFDCDDGAGYSSPASAPDASCPTNAVGNRAVRGKVIDQDEDFTEYAASVSVVALTHQTVTFTSAVPNPGVVGDTYPVSASASSSLPVDIVSLTTATCRYSGGVAVLEAEGMCTLAANQAGDATFAPAVQVTQSFTVVRAMSWAFGGFFQPVDNVPTVNTVKAGSAIPVKFSLGGDRGLNIFGAGSPSVIQVSCVTGAPTDMIEQTVAAGSSGLSYDATTQVYSYVWKTNKAWAGSCQQLSIRLADGTAHLANFALR